MNALRQISGGLVALLLLVCTVVASTLIAFAEFGATAATASATPAASAPPSPTLPSTATVEPRVTSTSAPSTPSPTLTLPLTSTPPASDTPLPPSQTAPATVVAPPTQPPRPTTCVPSPPADWVFYTVRQGDTLFSLSLRFGVSLATLQRVNCIANPADIKAGQRIYAPPASLATLTPAPEATETLPGDIPTITSVPVPTATPNCVPPEFFDPALGRCRLPDPTTTAAPTDTPGLTDALPPPTNTAIPSDTPGSN